MRNKFKTTEEILKGEEVHVVCEKLEDLHAEKLIQFGLTPPPPDDYIHPKITEVERNFSIVLEWERGFLMGGNPYGFNQNWREVLHCWKAVGMEKTALEMELFELIKDVEGKVLDSDLSKQTQEEIGNALCQVGQGIDKLRTWEDHSAALVAYVAANVDQFCKRGEDGRFV